MKSLLAISTFSAFLAMAGEPVALSLRFGEPLPVEAPPVDSNGPTAVDADGNLWFIQTVGGTIGSTPWRIFKGTNMDDLKFQYDYVPDKHWSRPHGDDTWWAEGLWIDPSTGTWHAIAHTEYNYNKYQGGTGYTYDRRNTVSLAISTNQGQSWMNSGEIIGSPHPDDPKAWEGKNYWHQGQGDPSLFVDNDYFYIYYNAGWVCRSNVSIRFEGVKVARCAIADKLAPGKWKKWYLGKWDSPGANGYDTDVFNENYSDTATVVYCKSKKRYICVTKSNGDWKYDGYISSCTDLGKQDWTKSFYFTDSAHKGYYTWMMDPSTRSRYVMEGDTFRWYGGENKVQGYWVALTDAPVNPVTKAPLYPPESVDDRNRGWDTAHFPPPDSRKTVIESSK